MKSSIRLTMFVRVLELILEETVTIDQCRQAIRELLYVNKQLQEDDSYEINNVG